MGQIVVVILNERIKVTSLLFNACTYRIRLFDQCKSTEHRLWQGFRSDGGSNGRLSMIDHLHRMVSIGVAVLTGWNIFSEDQRWAIGQISFAKRLSFACGSNKIHRLKLLFVLFDMLVIFVVFIVMTIEKLIVVLVATLGKVECLIAIVRRRVLKGIRMEEIRIGLMLMRVMIGHELIVSLFIDENLSGACWLNQSVLNVRLAMSLGYMRRTDRDTFRVVNEFIRRRAIVQLWPRTGPRLRRRWKTI